jgi:hypothetical protein
VVSKMLPLKCEIFLNYEEKLLLSAVEAIAEV